MTVPQPDRARLRALIYEYAHAKDRYSPLLKLDKALDALFDRLDELEAENERLREWITQHRRAEVRDA